MPGLYRNPSISTRGQYVNPSEAAIGSTLSQLGALASPKLTCMGGTAPSELRRGGGGGTPAASPKSIENTLEVSEASVARESDDRSYLLSVEC